MMGILYVVATPIGNLKDITLRALEILKQVDLILAEDTRVTKKLLNQYDVKKPLKRYDEHIAERVHGEVGDRLRKGERVALVSDAGTPGISDPGSRLVRFIQEELPDAKIIPIPGPSALVTALSVSGVNADRFTFLGYPPHKKGRQTFFKKLEIIEVRPIVLYESPHRLEKTLASISEVFGEGYEIIVARELTKLHEEIFRGSMLETQSHFQGEKKKGEFVIIIP
ncbi:MAG: 16S rRNA (cytidine(1402)-2'-O)-methyltransferase [Patescibacteria group bacterium]|nr:16S rRNA (cytidine(1402)-2'-O)-methyltransferase [Patescibacteria group bacterium]